MEEPGPRLQTGLNRLVDPALKLEGNSLEKEVVVREEKKMGRPYLFISLYLLFLFLFISPHHARREAGVIALAQGLFY